MPVKDTIAEQIDSQYQKRIALAKAEDIAAIASFKENCIKTSFAAFLNDKQIKQEIDYLARPNWVEKQILHPEAGLLVSKQGSAIVGLAGLQKSGEIIEICSLYTNPQNQGIMGELLQILFAASASLKPRQIQAKAFTDNQTSISFLERQGFFHDGPPYPAKSIPALMVQTYCLRS